MARHRAAWGQTCHRGEGRRPGVSQRGFTLTELMAVVVIMTILSTVGLASVRGHFNRAGKVQVQATMKAIAAAQERYRSENGRYLATSANINALYPMAAPDGKEYAFYGWNNPAWETLGADVTTPVTFGFASVEGLPTDVTTVFPVLQLQTQPAWTATRSPWYVIQAQGDSDEDGKVDIVVMTSFGPSVIWDEIP